MTRTDTDTRRRRDALRRLDDARERLGETLRELEAVPDANERGSAGTWSVTDVYAHLARWEDFSRQRITAHLRGEVPEEDPGYRVLNAKWLAEDETVAPGAARARFESAGAAYQNILQSIAAERWDSAIGDWVEKSINHYEDHLRAPLEFEVAPGG